MDKETEIKKQMKEKDENIFDDIYQKEIVKQTTKAVLSAGRKFDIMMIFISLVSGIGGAGIMGLVWKFYG